MTNELREKGGKEMTSVAVGLTDGEKMRSPGEGEMQRDYYWFHVFF